MDKRIIRITLFLLFAGLFLFASDLAAQCPMCRMSAESNLKNGGSAGQGLNAGILYMLSVPYLLVGGVAYYWWRKRRSAAVSGSDEG